MNADTITPQTMTIGLVVLAVLGLISIWTSGARTGRKAQKAAQDLGRRGGIVGRALMIAGVVAGVQWVALRYSAEPLVWALVLGLPALVVGIAVARLFAITVVTHGGRR